MSENKVEVTRITSIQPISGANVIECAYVYGNIPCVVSKETYNAGDLIAYIPIDYILPPAILEELKLVDKLSGSHKNRIKSLKIRNVYSEGLLYPARSNWQEGQNVIDELGITKYEEPEEGNNKRARNFAKSKYNNMFIDFDVENIRDLNERLFQELKSKNYYFEITEKIHGQSVQYAIDVENGIYATTKNIGKTNCYIDTSIDTNYTKILKKYDIADKLRSLKSDYPYDCVYILGEIYGKGVQDLTYGANGLEFIAYAYAVGKYNKETNTIAHTELSLRDHGLGFKHSYLFNYGSIKDFKTLEDFKQYLEQYVDGYELQSGNRNHMREGVIVRFNPDMLKDPILRFKCVSKAYKLRKNGTEFT
jgi:RNA ligase (TIGR02306 family)